MSADLWGKGRGSPVKGHASSIEGALLAGKTDDDSYLVEMLLYLMQLEPGYFSYAGTALQSVAWQRPNLVWDGISRFLHHACKPFQGRAYDLLADLLRSGVSEIPEKLAESAATIVATFDGENIDQRISGAAEFVSEAARRLCSEAAMTNSATADRVLGSRGRYLG